MVNGYAKASVVDHHMIDNVFHAKGQDIDNVELNTKDLKLTGKPEFSIEWSAINDLWSLDHKISELGLWG